MIGNEHLRIGDRVVPMRGEHAGLLCVVVGWGFELDDVCVESVMTNEPFNFPLEDLALFSPARAPRLRLIEGGRR